MSKTTEEKLLAVALAAVFFFTLVCANLACMNI